MPLNVDHTVFETSSTGIHIQYPIQCWQNSTPMGSRKRKQPEPLAIHGSYHLYEQRDGRPSSKAVRFRSTVLVHLIPRQREITWLSRAELSEIKRRARTSTVGKSIDLEKAFEACCSAINQSDDKGAAPALVYNQFSVGPERGLERRSSLAHCRARAVQVLACKTNFFIEQSTQLLNGKRDEEKLAAIYREGCRASKLFALMHGKADGIAAGYI
jgi:hypothetical protein